MTKTVEIESGRYGIPVGSGHPVGVGAPLLGTDASDRVATHLDRRIVAE